MIFLQRLPHYMILHLQDHTMKVKYAEAERLVDMLIQEMPNVPERAKIHWAMRIEPRGRIIERFSLIEEKITSVYHLEVYVPMTHEKVMFKGPASCFPLEAIQKGWDGWGDDIPVSETLTDQVSRKVAEKELEKKKAAEYTIKNFGMSLDDLVKYVTKHGCLPEIEEEKTKPELVKEVS